MPHPGLEPGPSDPESSALTTGPYIQESNLKLQGMAKEEPGPHFEKNINSTQILVLVYEPSLR